MRHVVVVGGGIFGVTAALALRRRGDRVTVVDPGPVPHPLAESTDLSKVVRPDYGADELYTGMMEKALDAWRRWNEAWAAPLFHETGVVFLSRTPLAGRRLRGEELRDADPARPPPRAAGRGRGRAAIPGAGRRPHRRRVLQPYGRLGRERARGRTPRARSHRPRRHDPGTVRVCASRRRGARAAAS